MVSVREYKFRALRRISQISIMILFMAGNIVGLHILRGNLSTSKVMDTLPLADPYAVLQIFAAVRIVSAETLFGASVVLLFFGLVAGRAFCSWVCPMNMVTDLANLLRKKTGLDLSGKSPALSRKARYWIFAVSLAVSFATGIAAFEWISPISMLHRGIIFGMGLGWTIAAAVFLFDLVWIRNGFCGHVCPLGGFYALTTGLSLIRIKHSKEKCTSCMKCIEVCPERQVLPMVGKASGAVTSGECTNCGRCVEVCNYDAMKFGTRFNLVVAKEQRPTC